MRNGHKVEVTLETAAFDLQKHRVQHLDGVPVIDGSRPIGTDGGVRPFSEFTRFEIRWDGKIVSLSKEAFHSIYNVSLRLAPSAPGDGYTVVAVLNQPGDSILIFLRCGDAVREWVWLTINKHGKWNRYVASEGDDTNSAK
jgi:hypothetical protein